MHELFDHTADLGLRIQSPDLNSLFAEAAECLYTAIFETHSEAIKPIEQSRIDIECTGNDLEFLLFDWLKELLYRFDCDGLAYSRFEVKVDATKGLQAKAWGEKIDPARHLLAREVKAITYHGLLVSQLENGWLAEVILDI